MSAEDFTDLETLRLQDDGRIPNSRLPVLLYRRVLAAGAERDPATIRERFARNGWRRSWVNGIHGFHHYHSSAHEALAVCNGWAEVQLGGEQGPILRIEAGDVVVLPAGVGHKNRGDGGGFAVVGAYPAGQSPDMRHGKPAERPLAEAALGQVALPAGDPVFGGTGLLLRHWRDL